MAVDVSGDEAAAPADGLPMEPRHSAQPSWPHRKRFVVVYALLALALGSAAAGVVVFANHTFNAGPAWSNWRPTDSGLGGAVQIASRVAPEYRLPDGKQLVDVIAKAPSVSPGNQTIPVHYVVVRGSGSGHDQIIDVSGDNSVMFTLCGLGPSCSIATGQASVARGRLVRREILELALYTFKYDAGIDSVIAFMPPRPGAAPQYVVYLQRNDLSAELSRPLADTLGSKTPLANTIPAREVRIVDATTESRVYSFSLSQAQQGDAILVLAPLA